MAKGAREKIKLESTAGTGHFYTTDKNKKTTPEKLELMKAIQRADPDIPFDADAHVREGGGPRRRSRRRSGSSCSA